ncbi:V-type proton ATPase subunit E-like [Dermacentor andersoni]|uniref:V-type proton ATPase subunit E-like n=1 Tax=Dermacentor andersoni TaxID=34620 RepID=UPI0021551BE3|nr:V-type proton ATPase subunit E-like [Dermacentor andersoni]
MAEKVRVAAGPTGDTYQMVAFIEQEADEKVEEIDTKAEEEFNTEKWRLVKEQRRKIVDSFSGKEKQVDRQRKIQNSLIKNTARLRILQAMNEHVARVVAETKKNLVYISGKESRYKPFLERLILQGLYRLLDKDVVLSCRKKDEALVKAATQVAVKQFRKRTNIQANVALDSSRWLPEESCGGVVLTSLKGRKKVVNTLAARLDLIAQHTLPDIRTQLFGPNAHRKYTT